jgi:hypothetical protein
MPHLPAELIDTVVDFLHDDEESLANCSLVCKEWVPATRYHIFNNLLLDRWNMEEFVDLITRPSATVALYINHLIIDQGKSRHTDLFQSMFRRLPHFHLLRTLELRNSRWADSLVFAFGGIRDLKLSRCTFANPVHLKTVISSFLSLKRLSVSHTRFLVEHDDLDQDVAVTMGYIQPLKFPDIDTLELWERHVTSWFPFEGAPIASCSIYLGRFCLSSLNRYLEVLGPSLRNLTLDISGTRALIRGMDCC